mgnify:CR=1 FL=1
MAIYTQSQYKAMLADKDKQIEALKAKASTSTPTASTASKATTPTASAPEPTAYDTYRALQRTNPREAGRFWHDHKNEILSSK